MSHVQRPAGRAVVGRPAAASAQGLADRQDLALIAVERSCLPMVITDPRQPDNPIVLANQAFLDICGYEAEEVVGRNCRFLQGPDTARDAVEAVRSAVAEGRAVEVELLNYRRDGRTFWNQLHLSPVHDDAGELIYFFGSQKDVTERREAEGLRAAEHRLLREVDHRAMNALALVQGIVRLSRAETTAAYAAAVQARVSALARAHTLLSRAGWTGVSLGEVLRGELDPYGDRIRPQGPELQVTAEQVQPLSLVLQELLSNAVAHGALSARDGAIDVVWRRPAEAIEIDWTERGPMRPLGPPGFGARMIDSIVRQQLRGALTRTWREDGLSLALSFPGPKA